MLEFARVSRESLRSTGKCSVVITRVDFLLVLDGLPSSDCADPSPSSLCDVVKSCDGRDIVFVSRGSEQ